jgi:hypothetical protein
MEKILASKRHTRMTAKAAKRVNSKKVFASTISTFLMLVVVCEGLRLAFQGW